MKMHITTEQLNELAEEQKEKLREWWKPEETDWYVCVPTDKRQKPYEEFCYCDYEYMLFDYESKCDHVGKAYPLLSIGQLIEFIEDLTKKPWFDAWYEPSQPIISGEDFCAFNNFEGELCDVLWKAVKYILREE